MTAVVAAQVAFWRQIPVVHLQAGVATDDLLCPFPQEANRRDHRPARLPVPHHRRRRARQPDRARTRSPSATRWPPTRSPPTCASPACVRRVRTDGPRLVLVGAGPSRLPRRPREPPGAARRASRTSRSSLFGRLAAHGAAHPLAAARRGPSSSATCPLAELRRADRGEHRARLRRPRAGRRTHRGSARPPCSSTARTSPQPGDSIRSILSPARHGHRPAGARRRTGPRPEPSDGLEARAGRAGGGVDVRAHARRRSSTATAPDEHRRQLPARRAGA